MQNELIENTEIEIDELQVTSDLVARSPGEEVEGDNEIAIYRLTTTGEKIQKEKFLFLKDAWNTLAYDPEVTKTRTFSLNKQSWDQLCQLNPEIDRWDRLTQGWHWENLLSQGTNVSSVVELPIVRELHYIYEMTFLVSYELGKPNPLEDTLFVFNDIRADKERLGEIVNSHSWKSDGPHISNYGTLQISIISREHSSRESYIQDTFIAVNQVGPTINIELPWHDIWGDSGLEWIWHRFFCCDMDNITPWAGRVCNCIRPF